MKSAQTDSRHPIYIFAFFIGAGFFIFLFVQVANAQSVSSLNSPAFVSVDAQGSLVAAGNQKILQWPLGQAGKASKAFAWPETQSFTALQAPQAEIWQGHLFACLPEALLIWEENQAAPRPLNKPEEDSAWRDCIWSNGKIALLSQQNKIIFGQWSNEKQLVEWESSERPAFFHTPSEAKGAVFVRGHKSNAQAADFVLVGPRGGLEFWKQQEEGGIWERSNLARTEGASHPQAEVYTGLTRIDDLFLWANGNGVWLAERQPEQLVVSRLPVSPCADEERCGVSLASDRSWMVCGSWGCYLGLNDRFQRLALPQFGEEDGFFAVSHSGLAGHFALLGPRDGDRGKLPVQTRDLAGAQKLRSLPFAGFNNGENKEKTHKLPRYIAWTKPKFSSAREAQLSIAIAKGASFLFPYSVHKKGVEHFGGVVWGYKDALNEKKSEFVAWEDERAFLPPLQKEMASQTQSVESFERDPWWHESLGLKDFHLELKSEFPELKPALIALVDSGVDLQHPMILNQIDASSFDFVEEDSTPQDDFGHGTHVAALASSELGEEVFGVAPRAPLLVVKALDANGRSNTIDLARGLAYTAQQQAKVVNCSWGGGPRTQALEDAFSWLVSQGVFVATSAGNDNLDLDKNPQVPKNYPGVFVTGAHAKPRGNAVVKTSSSNVGERTVAVFAPGDGIESALPGGGLGFKSGTSMASPMSAGLASVLMGLGFSASETSAILCKTSHKSMQKVQSRCGVLHPIGALREAARLRKLMPPR
jgi:hypothetical protein